MPSSDPFDESEDEDETLTQRAKRQRLSDVYQWGDTVGDRGQIASGEVAGEATVP